MIFKEKTNLKDTIGDAYVMISSVADNWMVKLNHMYSIIEGVFLIFRVILSIDHSSKYNLPNEI